CDSSHTAPLSAPTGSLSSAGCVAQELLRSPHRTKFGGSRGLQEPQFRLWRAAIHWLSAFTSAALKPVAIASATRCIISRSSGPVDFAGQDDRKCPQA